MTDLSTRVYVTPQPLSRKCPHPPCTATDSQTNNAGPQPNYAARPNTSPTSTLPACTT